MFAVVDRREKCVCVRATVKNGHPSEIPGDDVDGGGVGSGAKIDLGTAGKSATLVVDEVPTAIHQDVGHHVGTIEDVDHVVPVPVQDRRRGAADGGGDVDFVSVRRIVQGRSHP